MQGRPGPVVLVLPEDMLTQPITAPVVAPARVAEAAPTPAALAELRERLAAAKQPLVIAGGGGWTPEATRALQTFAEAWQLPVGCAFRFQDLFDNAHPNYAGDVGIGINPQLAARVKAADLILAIGPRLGEMTTGGYTLLQAPRPAQQLIHIHAGAEELGRVYTAELLINASMSQAAPALAGLEPPADIAWRDWTAAAHADYQANLVPTPVAPLDMAEVIRLIDAKLPEGTIFTNGAGNYSGWLHRFHRYTALHRFGKTQLAPTSGAMGYGVPAAVAAALLQDRWVVNIAGDGDFLMTGQELATATGYGAKKLLVVVVDNGTYGTIRMHQEREYPGRVSGSDLFNPDFAKLAEAFGFAALYAESTDEVGPALDAAIAAGRPALLHLRLSSDVSTSRSTLTAIRDAARKARHA
jgi:acetolactate synthase-1/2/3 large subunit